jgi:hypothetical protein
MPSSKGKPTDPKLKEKVTQGIFIPGSLTEDQAANHEYRNQGKAQQR